MDRKKTIYFLRTVKTRTRQSEPKPNGTNPNNLDTLCWNLVDSAIDAGIAGLATGFLVNIDVSWKVALGTFLLEFLVKLKEFRKR
jgi:hypothetical protein